ncbi:hypothetical protein C8J56DRAFT_1055794 [Mycena floridula]|nr:hypothetical protein C8J56DRAFT_1055794 [Mycena floridula]
MTATIDSVGIKRQPHVRGSRKPLLKSSIFSSKSKALHIIPEEEEQSSPRPSTSSLRSDSPMPTKRRQNLTGSDIRLTKDNTCQDEVDLSFPRPAPKPPATPSPTGLTLNFTDVAFHFPHPPARFGSQSPTPSLSPSSSSPGSWSAGLPVTPNSSDDETFQDFSPKPFKRATIKPLVVNKNNNVLKSELSLSSGSGDDESDIESDSEWYSREFGKILTPLRPSFSSNEPSARPESLLPFDNLPPSPTPKARSGRPLPFTPLSSLVSGYPSAQLDPGFPRRLNRDSIVNRAPPPPVPEIPTHFRSLSKEKLRPPPLPLSESLPTRPPPRSSVPADFGFFPDEAEEYEIIPAIDVPVDVDEDETGGLLTYYSQPHSALPVLESPASVYSQVTQVSPTSLMGDYYLDVPRSPLDLEKDIESGLQQLRFQSDTTEAEPTPAASCSSASSTYSFPSETDAGDSSSNARVLRSRWSSSTLSSIREENRSSSIGKLRGYFGSKKSSSPRGRTSIAFSSLSPSPSEKRFRSPVSPVTPMSPFTSKRHRSVSRRDSDVMVVGYGASVKRRGSTSTTSSSSGGTSIAESDDSSASSGLRRKPIPVEMFLRA